MYRAGGKLRRKLQTHVAWRFLDEISYSGTTGHRGKMSAGADGYLAFRLAKYFL